MEQRNGLTGFEAYQLRLENPTLETKHEDSDIWYTHSETSLRFSYTIESLSKKKWSIRTRKTDKDKLKEELRQKSFKNIVSEDMIYLHSVENAIDKYWPKEKE